MNAGRLHFGAALLAVVALACSLRVSHAHSIEDFGAVAGDSATSATQTNAQALLKAFVAANASATDRTVEVPAGKTFYTLNVTVADVHNVSLQVRGELWISNIIADWDKETWAAFLFESCSGLEITGNGTIEGQGYDWWWHVIIGKKDHRPHMIAMQHCVDVEIHHIKFQNSPRFHVFLEDIYRATVHHTTIFVDVDAQKQLLAKFGFWDEGIPIPTFPLNTDGIDPSGSEVLIYDVDITNFDDAVAVKPRKNLTHSQCTENIVVRDSTVTYGVGMTIGSVPPHSGCIRNITFENIQFNHPIKAIYVKTNPGDDGTTFIDSVTYRNISAKNSLWYPIWIGPQQQRQPGTAGTGCSFFYPINDTCPTQPRVTITNITLDNVHMWGSESLTLPGVLLCDEANPCTGFVFRNVTVDGDFVVSKDYACKNVEGTALDGTEPVPAFSAPGVPPAARRLGALGAAAVTPAALLP